MDTFTFYGFSTTKYNVSVYSPNSTVIPYLR